MGNHVNENMEIYWFEKYQIYFEQRDILNDIWHFLHLLYVFTVTIVNTSFYRPYAVKVYYR